jgi:hypothetical protein
MANLVVLRKNQKSAVKSEGESNGFFIGNDIRCGTTLGVG